MVKSSKNVCPEAPVQPTATGRGEEKGGLRLYIYIITLQMKASLETDEKKPSIFAGPEDPRTAMIFPREASLSSSGAA
jgi:hypothetical protein